MFRPQIRLRRMREKLELLFRPRLKGRITLQPVQIERERAALGSASEDDACAMYDPSDSSYSRCGAFFSE